jgi:hypothetical protein
MGIYVVNTLWVIGEGAGGQIGRLTGEGWEVEYQSERLVILSVDGNHCWAGIPEGLPDSLVAVCSTTAEMPYGENLSVWYGGDFVFGSFDDDETVEVFASTSKERATYAAEQAATPAPQEQIEQVETIPNPSLSMEQVEQVETVELHSEDDFLARLANLPT